MANLWRDARFGLRLLAKNLGFTSVALLALALGIGANAAIFSIVYATVLSPMPFPNADQLVTVWSKINGNRNGVSAGDYLDWKKSNTVFQDINAWSGTNFNLSSSGPPEQVRARLISPGSNTMMGTRFFLGRDFLPEEGEVGKDHVVIMTHRLWQERFGSDPNILGRQVCMNGELYMVVGVMPPGQPDRLESHYLCRSLSSRSRSITIFIGCWCWAGSNPESRCNKLTPIWTRSRATSARFIRNLIKAGALASKCSEMTS